MTDINSIGRLMIGHFLSFIFTFGSATIIARLLGPEGRGELGAIMALPLTLPAIAGLGLWQSVTYYSVKHPNQVGNVLGTGLVLSLSWCTLICAIAVPIQYQILSNHSPEVQLAGVVFLIFVPINIIYAMPWHTFQGLKLFGIFSILRSTPEFAVLLTSIITLVIGLNVATDVSTGYLLMYVLVCMTSSWITYKKVVARSINFQITLAKRMLRYAIPTLLSTIPVILYQRLDQILIASWRPKEELGLYIIAVSWSSITPLIMGAFGTVLLPVLADKRAVEQMVSFERTLRWSLALTVGSSIFLAGLTPFVIPLFFGDEFAGAIKVALILVLANGLGAATAVLQDGFRGLGRPGVTTYSSTACLGVSVVGLSLFLVDYGYLGAAWVSLAAQSVGFIILLALFNATYPITLHGWLNNFYSDISLISKRFRVRGSL